MTFKKMTSARVIKSFISILALVCICLGICSCDNFTDDSLYSRVSADGVVSIHFIDVGQADSVLIMTPEGNILVDAGTNSSEEDLKNYLLELEITEIEYFVLTHPHDDHVGGADMILREFYVENVVMTECDEDISVFSALVSEIEDKDVNVIDAVSGESFEVGECKSTVLAPNREYGEYDETNSTSVVLKCEIGEFSVILTGDAEDDSEQEMIERYGDFLDCDILKLGHHGSKTSSLYKFLEITSPEYAIACCGKDNTYGHPAAEVIYRLNAFDIDLLRTDKEGSIVFIYDGEELEYIG